MTKIGIWDLDIHSSLGFGDWTLTSVKITKFQKKVYKIVSKIPRGQVRSYKWVAERIGRPKAARAVGQALKKNPFVGIVPCHRVIAFDGSLGGFSKGVKKKKQMLRKEGIKFYSIGNYINLF